MRTERLPLVVVMYWVTSAVRTPFGSVVDWKDWTGSGVGKIPGL